MPDNITISPSQPGGVSLKTVEYGSAHWQEVLMAFDPSSPTPVDASNPFPVAVDQLPAAAALADATANPTTSIIGAAIMCLNGTTFDRLPGSSTNGLLVNLGANNDVSLAPRTSGGCSIFRSIDLDESSESVKAGAGQVYAITLSNLHASDKRYVKLYDNASPTVGTTAPVLTIPIAAGATVHLEWEHGLAFATAIHAAATTAVADDDTGAPGANEVVVNIAYK